MKIKHKKYKTFIKVNDEYISIKKATRNKIDSSKIIWRKAHAKE